MALPAPCCVQRPTLGASPIGRATWAAAHYYEAILATASIVVWHFYMVVFDPDVYPMDRSWLTGKTSADHLRHSRPEYAAQLESAAQPEPAEAAPTSEAPPAEDEGPPSSS